MLEMNFEQAILAFFAFVLIAIGLVILDAHYESKRKWGNNPKF